MESLPPTAALLGERGRGGSARDVSAQAPSGGTSRRPGAGPDPGSRSEHRASARVGHSKCSGRGPPAAPDRKSTRLNSSHSQISYAVFCLKKKKKNPHSALAQLTYYAQLSDLW